MSNQTSTSKNRAEWADDPRSIYFILPGHNVELREGDRIREEDGIPKTGSSVATALAAGLTALIIHYVRLGAVYSWHRGRVNDGNAVNEDSVRAIKRHGVIREAPMRISAGYTDKNRRLEVESFFRDPAKVLDPYNRVTDESKWEKVAQLARDLVSSNT
ncbi:hypothetical protein B0T18DRAFT_428538 [Schizothecium vesticola]|uniref:Peptidase S8/S53 domain-containing protein n=1 Tax=Schizothecium vesticola TaxID=314040 RepID=A0AA40K9B6_9PEZI|nr:hypothetical protein B0T18DRAFT_428538 [Schizothecium vesticola]